LCAGDALSSITKAAPYPIGQADARTNGRRAWKERQLRFSSVERAPSVDVVVVAYNSRAALRESVAPLVDKPDINVIVVDNASPDDSAAVVADLALTLITLERNGGFAHGCNVGWRAGSAPYVLFLNPDARISHESVRALADVLRLDPGIGISAPRIAQPDGALEFSQRRFPRLRSTYARALFLHRLFPRTSWADELVRDPRAYAAASAAEWVSGACLLVGRRLLETLDGWDEGFFMYCEDIDLCARVRDLGYTVRFEPGAVAHHEGGASAPRASLLPTLAESRMRYARKHRSRLGSFAERCGLGLEALTHALVSVKGGESRRGHASALRRIIAPVRSG
jgi:hypothetical protein